MVDFPAGLVGRGAVAPAFGALTHRYAMSHFGQVNSRRFVGLIGDTELDEGNVWEAILEQTLTGLENLLWVVDLNRQSLDRVVPGIRAGQLERLFEESGWVVTGLPTGVIRLRFSHENAWSILQQLAR